MNPGASLDVEEGGDNSGDAQYEEDGERSSRYDSPLPLYEEDNIDQFQSDFDDNMSQFHAIAVNRTIRPFSNQDADEYLLDHLDDDLDYDEQDDDGREKEEEEEEEENYKSTTVEGGKAPISLEEGEEILVSVECSHERDG